MKPFENLRFDRNITGQRYLIVPQLYTTGSQPFEKVKNQYQKGKYVCKLPLLRCGSTKQYPGRKVVGIELSKLIESITIYLLGAHQK